jgi:hypothetical protein
LKRSGNELKGSSQKSTVIIQLHFFSRKARGNELPSKPGHQNSRALGCDQRAA